MTKPLKILTISAALALCACTTTNPYTNEKQASKAVVYGGGAAVVCGLIGAIESGKHARNAALGCGAIGAGVGAYMDVQEAKLREQLQGTGVSVMREGENIRLVMPGNITFASNKSLLNNNFYATLNSVALVLAKYADTSIRVTGHTDNTGSDQYNQQLSQQRAQSVSNYLTSQGVAAQRLFVQGMGESQAIADNSTADGRASNRRVELFILPKAQ